MKQTFEVIYVEKVRSRVYIEADDQEHVQQLFDDGDFKGHEAQELEAWDAEVETIKELEEGN
ncbi:hypothetical protein LLR47_19690 [Bacillus cereus]|uniref:hypothetical protein n=1 Tax=Bacillus cereus TaxID=1396 RepID=UPI001D14F887|nr:hypothetical protein [Bacillus cereus]MCC3687428.1 hypothetical protein [Bacillus cereus]